MRLFYPSSFVHDNSSSNNVVAVLPHVLLLCCWLLLLEGANAGKPAPAHYFPEQIVDHFATTSAGNNTRTNKQQEPTKKWSQRYYIWKEHFKGPGSPIFLIFGGEGAISPNAGILYPFVCDYLATHFGAFVLQPEHRFYGFSQPLSSSTKQETPTLSSSSSSSSSSSTTLRGRRKNRRTLVEGGDGGDDDVDEDPRVHLFTSEQAIMDAVVLVQYIATERLGCSLDKASKDYCPVISVGGSYPGFLSAFSRLVVPNVFDISYAASAPMKFYSQQVHQDDYYNHITKVAEKTIKGCSKAVRDTLTNIVDSTINNNNINNNIINNNTDNKYIPATEVGVCPGTLPDYITTRDMFLQELFMMVAYSFANDNMANYPPSPKTRLYRACQVFLSDDLSDTQKVKTFLVERLGGGGGGNKDQDDCFDMNQQLPTGRHATISGGDWSGDGTGANGESWDFQTCTLLVEKIGFSTTSMFPPRNWTLDWMTDHCQKRFGVTPRPTELVTKWKFNDLVAANASRILFTNGLNDGWSVGAVTQNLSDTILAINFPNGAHHSDLNGYGPRDTDTDDIKQGYKSVQTILEKWLKEIKEMNE